MEVSRCPGRGQLRDSWEGCDFYIVRDFYPLSLFTVLVSTSVFWFLWDCFARSLVVLSTNCTRNHVLFGMVLTPNTFFCCLLAVELKKKRCWIIDFSLLFSDPLSLQAPLPYLYNCLVAEKSYKADFSAGKQLFAVLLHKAILSSPPSGFLYIHLLLLIVRN